VDDSVNILSEHPVNKQRIEEGLPPLRILWPWGQGFRWPLPNFALRRGEMVWVESDSLRVAGLTRLLGYRHGTRYAYGRGLKLDFEALLKQLLTRSPVILLFDQFLKLRELRRFEDMRRFYVQLGTSLIRPLLEYAQEEPLELLFLSPSFSDAAREGEFSRGLGLYFQNLQPMTSTFPFDERVFEDKRVPRRVLWQEIEKVL
jgi:2,3-bisphosphoglycerate-independent phosphoglycerate mutase